ncbi:hypothetical protein N480_00415 [Pseudoalteromonas luteoviolacea S2607]|nr:hypothetical protein [Pseudoalteromonas luteoviolacea]KZN39324.1 hypothetical protein N480_00415 [Pseudoalteromonas luteoviolacea S2607]
MDGWLSAPDWPFWYGKFGDEKHIMASSEPVILLHLEMLMITFGQVG